MRIKNLMLPGTEGGVTLYKGEKLPIYDAAMRYIADGTPTTAASATSGWETSTLSRSLG